MSNNVVLHFIKTTPPITRALVLITILISSAVYLDLIASQQISYSRFYLKDLELHRLFTSFFYYGRGNFELVMNFIFLYKYSSVLEESYGRTSDYLYVIFIIFICLGISSTVLYIPFLATPLSNTITYIWTRKNPQSIVQMFGFVSFSAFYLPFVYPVVTLIFEGSISKDEIIGIVVGHVVFYFTEVYPKFGMNILATPCFLHRIFKEECDKCKKKISDESEKTSSGSVENRRSELKPLIIPASKKELVNDTEGEVTNNISGNKEDGVGEQKDVFGNTGCIEKEGIVTGTSMAKVREDRDVSDKEESDMGMSDTDEGKIIESEDFESEDINQIEEVVVEDENSWESS